MKFFSWLAYAVLFVAGIGGPAVAAPMLGKGEPIVLGQGFTLPSTIMGEARRINVLLPPGYHEPAAKARRYAVLYLLDGGAGWQDYAHIAAMVEQGGRWEVHQPLIVVGVESKDRRGEFTDPSAVAAERKDFPTHGQNATFRRFLLEEVKPAIDAAYRTSGDDGLIGESLAAYFVVDTALHTNGGFDRYIAISPSLWWNDQNLARRAAALLARPGQPVRSLWLSIADEGGTMQAGVDRLVVALKGQAAPRLAWRYTPYPREKHGSIYHPAATQAIRDIYPLPPTTPAQ